FSADPAVAPWWKGHETRAPFDVPPFGADDPTHSIPVTDLERFTLERMRKLHGHSSAGTDALAQQIYEGYAQTSTTLARDVVQVFNSTKGAVLPKPDYCASYAPFGVTFGAANGGVDLTAAADMTLRLLK